HHRQLPAQLVSRRGSVAYRPARRSRPPAPRLAPPSVLAPGWRPSRLRPCRAGRTSRRGTWSLPWRRPSVHLVGIESVAEGVTEQVEAEHGDEDRGSGGHGVERRYGDQLAPRVEHRAP